MPPLIGMNGTGHISRRHAPHRYCIDRGDVLRTCRPGQAEPGRRPSPAAHVFISSCKRGHLADKGSGRKRVDRDPFCQPSSLARIFGSGDEQRPWRQHSYRHDRHAAVSPITEPTLTTRAGSSSAGRLLQAAETGFWVRWKRPVTLRLEHAFPGFSRETRRAACPNWSPRCSSEHVEAYRTGCRSHPASASIPVFACNVATEPFRFARCSPAHCSDSSAGRSAGLFLAAGDQDPGARGDRVPRRPFARFPSHHR